MFADWKNSAGVEPQLAPWGCKRPAVSILLPGQVGGVARSYSGILKRSRPSRRRRSKQVVAKVEAWRTAEQQSAAVCDDAFLGDQLACRCRPAAGMMIRRRAAIVRPCPVRGQRRRLPAGIRGVLGSASRRRHMPTRSRRDPHGPPQPAGGRVVSGSRAAVAAKIGPISQSYRWHRSADACWPAFAKRYDERGCAFQVAQVAGGYQLLSRPEFAAWLRPQAAAEQEIRLSPPALETLAVVAYRQPVLRAEVEAIRGVACGEILRQLMDRDLLRIVGRSEELGRPLRYGTTKRFLEVFGLCNLDELPWAAQLRRSAQADDSDDDSSAFGGFRHWLDRRRRSCIGCVFCCRLGTIVVAVWGDV